MESRPVHERYSRYYKLTSLTDMNSEAPVINAYIPGSNHKGSKKTKKRLLTCQFRHLGLLLTCIDMARIAETGRVNKVLRRAIAADAADHRICWSDVSKRHLRVSSVGTPTVFDLVSHLRDLESSNLTHRQRWR